MSDTSFRASPQLSSAMDRAEGYALALRALGCYLQDFEAADVAPIAVSVLSDGLSEALAAMRAEINPDRV